MLPADNSVKLCAVCHQAEAHPAYNDFCEDCFVDKKLMKAYGSRPRDRRIGHSPHSTGASPFDGSSIEERNFT